MPLTDANRKELEEMGAANVRVHITGSPGGGKHSTVGGFRTGDILRGDIYDWLAAKDRADEQLLRGTYRWARIAGWVGIVGAIIGALAIILPLVPGWPK